MLNSPSCTAFCNLCSCIRMVETRPLRSSLSSTSIQFNNGRLSLQNQVDDVMHVPLCRASASADHELN